MRTLLQPTSAEIDAAVSVAGEYNSEESVVIDRPGCWPATGRRCSACGEAEEDTGDNNADGTKVIAVPSERFVACASACGCLAHRECLRDRGALCPHCVVVRDDLDDARAMLAFCPDVTLVFALGQIAAAKRRATGVPE